MEKETLARLQRMSAAEKEKRLRELLAKHNVAPTPAALADTPPAESSLEEVEEREWLEKDLGYS